MKSNTFTDTSLSSCSLWHWVGESHSGHQVALLLVSRSIGTIENVPENAQDASWAKWRKGCVYCISRPEQVDESSTYLGHSLKHSLAGGSILLELEHLKSQKNVFIMWVTFLLKHKLIKLWKIRFWLQLHVAALFPLFRNLLLFCIFKKVETTTWKKSCSIWKVLVKYMIIAGCLTTRNIQYTL